MAATGIKQINLRVGGELADLFNQAEQVTGMKSVDILRTLAERHLKAYVAEIAAERQKAIDAFLSEH